MTPHFTSPTPSEIKHRMTIHAMNLAIVEALGLDASRIKGTDGVVITLGHNHPPHVDVRYRVIDDDTIRTLVTALARYELGPRDDDSADMAD